MQSTDRARMPTNQVMALFADRAVSFSLSTGATFADLAERLHHFGEWQIGGPTAIYLKVVRPRTRFLFFNPDLAPRSIPAEEASSTLGFCRALDPDQCAV